MNYEKIYNEIIFRAKHRDTEGYVEYHHVIPRCLGGGDEQSNIVVLTPEEHFICHVLLVKIYPNNGRLIYAVQAMCRGQTGRRRRKMYGWLKRRFSTQRKKDSSGSGNPQYGKQWINKIGTTENKTISISDPIPEGRQPGRRLTLRHCNKCGNTITTTKRNNKRLCGHYKCLLEDHHNARKSRELQTNDKKEQIKIEKEAIFESNTRHLYQMFLNSAMSIYHFSLMIGIPRQTLMYRFKKYSLKF